MDPRRALPLLLALVAAAVLWSTMRSREWSEVAAPSEPVEQLGTPADGIELETAAPPYSARSSVQADDLAAPVVSEPVLVVAVSTWVSRNRRAIVAPAVPIELGVGTALDPGEPALAKSVTDAAGLARVAIPWSAVEVARAKKPGARLWARVTGPGLQRSWASMALTKKPDPTSLKLFAQPGATVSGRLLAAGDLPVSGRVNLYFGERPYHRAPHERGHAGEDGWFEFHVKREGDYVVTADAHAHGTGALRDLRVRFDSDTEPLEVYVRGPGVVRGRVRDAEGRPAAMLDLLVMLASLDPGTGSYPLHGSALDRRLEGGGHLRRVVRTDADGAFEVLGLRADPYVVRARTNLVGNHPILLTRAPAPSDGVSLELTFGHPYLVVRLVTKDGSPWITPVFLDNGIWFDEVPPRFWPRKLRLIVAPMGEAARFGGQCPYLDGRAVAGGEYHFEVEEGRRYLVGLMGGAMRWRPVEHVQPIGAVRDVVTLTVAESPSKGALFVAAEDWEGAAVERNLAIRIEDPSTGMPLLVNDKLPSTWPYRLELPEGRYRLVVEGAADLYYESTMLLAERGHGRFATTVTVLDGQDTRILATLPKGARLRVRIAGNVREADREAVRKYDRRSEQIEDWAARTSLALFADGRWAEPILFRREWTDGTSAGTSLASELALNREQTSELLSAGRFRVEARLPGGRVVSRSVVLVDGETTAVDFSFE